MRISTSQQYGIATDQMNRSLDAYQTAQTKVSTGKSFNTLSDDPFAAMRSLTMRSVRSAVDQYGANLTHAKNSLGTTENALGQMADLMKQANTLAISASNAATDQSSRSAMVTQISSIQSQLVNLANTQGASGEYVFAGQKNNAAPFTLTGSTLNFNGDTNSISAEVGATTNVTLTTDISSKMTNLYSQLESMKTNLSSGNTAGLSSQDITNTQAGFDTLNQLRGDAGARLQSVNNQISVNKRQSDDLTTSISNNEDVDLAKAISDMQLAQTAYQGALSVANSSFKLNLMDYMR